MSDIEVPFLKKQDLDSQFTAAVSELEKGTQVIPKDPIFGVPRKNPESFFLKTLLLDRFEILSYIQSGSFGRGWKGEDKKTGKAVFIKTLRSESDRKSSYSRATEDMAKKEVEFLTSNRNALKLEHKNVCKLFPLYGEASNNGVKQDMFFFYSPDLCECGELFDYIVIPNEGIKDFPEPVAQHVFKQLVDGVAYLHEQGCYHRDLKPENIAFDADFVLKIIDFGTAKWQEDCVEVEVDGEKQYFATTRIGTRAYRPPEISAPQYDPACFDLWSMGVVLFYLVGMQEMHSKRINFRLFEYVQLRTSRYADLLDTRLVQLMPNLPKAPEHPKLWRQCHNTAASISVEMRNLIGGLVNPDFKHRFKISDVKSHPWVTTPRCSWDDYVKEMGSRCSKSRDRTMMFDFNPNSTAFSIACIVEKALNNLEEQYAVTIAEGWQQVLIGSPPLFSLSVKTGVDKMSLALEWLDGTLAEWLNFSFAFESAYKGASP